MPRLNSFDLVLSVPQWQGSGRSKNLLRGGLATAEICSEFGPRHDIPIGSTSPAEHGINNWAVLFDQMRAIADGLNASAPATVLTAGGDCSVDVPVINYLSGRYPDLTVVWIDAHLDANSPETTPSGNFHGMPVRLVLGDVPDVLRPYLQNPVAPDRFYYQNARVADQGDIEFQLLHGLRSLPARHRFSGPVHIHFDLDVLEPTEFPYLAYPEANGLRIDDAVSLLKDIAAQAQVVGLTFTEFSPADDTEADAGKQVIRKLCEAVVLTG